MTCIHSSSRGFRRPLGKSSFQLLFHEEWSDEVLLLSVRRRLKSKESGLLVPLVDDECGERDARITGFVCQVEGQADNRLSDETLWSCFLDPVDDDLCR